MKATLYNVTGEKKGEIETPAIFDAIIREDIAAKYFEVDKFYHAQPYSHDPMAGRKHSASGTISHMRHAWGGHYGKGIARIPRKQMWRRGNQFYWIGAEITSTRGGRRVHGPKLIKKGRRINKKEIRLAMSSGFASTANKDFVLKRYEGLNNKEIKLPIVIESKVNGMKSRDALKMIKNIFGDNFSTAIRKKSVRAGKGKSRNRRYKSTAGLLFVKGKDENVKINFIDVKSSNEVSIKDLYPLGRLTIYTQKALEEIK